MERNTRSALRHWADASRALQFRLQALPPLYFVFLPMILLAYMVLTQAVKGFYIRKFCWQ